MSTNGELLDTEGRPLHKYLQVGILDKMRFTRAEIVSRTGIKSSSIGPLLIHFKEREAIKQLPQEYHSFMSKYNETLKSAKKAADAASTAVPQRPEQQEFSNFSTATLAKRLRAQVASGIASRGEVSKLDEVALALARAVLGD
jgi:hypothetical protein